MGEINDLIPKEPGVYFLTDKEGISYVGSSNNIEMRRRNHLHHLKKGTHYNKSLQVSYDRDGEIELTYALTETIELANELEQNLLDEFYKGGVLHNASSQAKLSMLAPEIQLGNKWAAGREVTPETRKKISESNAGKEFSEEHKARLKEAKYFPVVVNGVEYRNAHDAARVLGVSHDVVKNRIKNPNYPTWKKLG